MEPIELIAGIIMTALGSLALRSASKVEEKDHWLYKKVWGIGIVLFVVGLALALSNLYLLLFT